jgi:hypothetical protein
MRSVPGPSPSAPVFTNLKIHATPHPRSENRREKYQARSGTPGFAAVPGAGQWLEAKHGAKSRRKWRKLHLAVDAASGMIVAQTLTDQDADDPSQVAPLLDQIDGQITRVPADGAYDGAPHLPDDRNAWRWYRRGDPAALDGGTQRRTGLAHTA